MASLSRVFTHFALVALFVTPALAGCDCSGDTAPGDASMDAPMGDASLDGMGLDGMLPDAGDGAMGDGALGDGGDAGDAGDGGGPVLSCDSVTPNVVSSQVDSLITAVGVGLELGGNLVLRDVDAALEVDLGAATVSPAGDRAEATLAAGAAVQGYYSVFFVASDGTELGCGELQVSALPPPTVTDVVPDTAWHGISGDGVLSDRTLTIFGTGFQNTPSVTFVNRADPSLRFNALLVNYVSSTELSAIVPSETLSMPAGLYDVWAVNPDGLSALWLQADGVTVGDFTITGTAPPTILSLNPVRSPAAADVTLTLTGVDFQDGAIVSILLPDGSRLELVTTFVSATELTAELPGGTVGIGPHPVIVTNPDAQFDSYYVYSATASSAGHLGTFEETGVDLVTARWRHSTEIGFDPFARGYLFVNGGLDAAGVPLGSTEILEISAFGEPSPPRLAEQWLDAASPRVENLLATPRAAHVLLRAGRFLYAIGGASDDTHIPAPTDSQLDTIERAKILDFDEMPQARLPVSLGGSGLPNGTWYYQVTALGPWGESLPSREVQLLRRGGRVEICWTGVTDATGYNLYRSVASDGRAGTVRLLVSELSGTCTTDTGRDLYQPAPGRVRAQPTGGAGLAPGVWAYRVTAVVGGVETSAGYRAYVDVAAGADQQVTLRWDPVVDATFNVYRTPTELTGAPVGDEATYRIATGLTDRLLVDDGLPADLGALAPDGLRPLTPGAISRWTTLGVTLNEAREGLDGVVLTVPSGSDTIDDRTMIIVAGGRASSAEAAPYSRTTEFAIVDTVTGVLEPFALDAELFNTPRGFYSLLTNVGQREARRPPPPEEPPCVDLDGDGVFSPACGGCDCNDTDPTIYCGAPEICGDGIDQSCDGMDPTCACPADLDGDGVEPPSCGGCDCNDGDPSIFCGATDVCDDGVDQDCDGVDATCACPADLDGDGEDIPECGGCDCNDGDPSIHCGVVEDCDLAPALCDDGIDQDCDGFDCNCVIIFSAELPSSLSIPPVQDDVISRYFRLLPPWSLESGPAFMAFPVGEGQTRSIATEPVLLIAVAGDDQYDAGNNQGMTTFEVVEISTANDATNGTLLGWTLQTNALQAGRRVLGADALLYFDYMFTFPGVASEDRSAPSISPQNSAGPRFPFVETPAAAAEYVGTFESSSVGMTTYRGYYTINRINGGLFMVGGHDGAGPVAQIERTIP
ncbi:MAG: MopE-related protein [Myxococcales bacterium]|nr:MopE-related protein [Myxococcales bacterium]